MRLSKRMHMVADMVRPGNVLADIGCDHGYLSVWLVREKTVGRAIAMDLREGPLKKAQESIRFFHQTETIETRLSDGMDALHPGEADRIVIAGMGGILMKDILKRGSDCVAKAGQLVLQPQSDPELVRAEVFRQGFTITDEQACFEDGKWYVSISAEPGTEETPYTDAELRLGRILPMRGDKVYRDYLTEELGKAERMLEGLLSAETDNAKEWIPAIRQRVSELHDALAAASDRQQKPAESGRQQELTKKKGNE